MPTRVVDASVLASMVFNEDRAAEAKGLIDGVQVAAPVLMAYEMTNIARKKVLAYSQDATTIEGLLQDALNFNIRWREVDHPAVLRLAMATGLSTYDASYLWLARTLAVPLVTFDEKLRAVL